MRSRIRPLGRTQPSRGRYGLRCGRHWWHTDVSTHLLFACPSWGTSSAGSTGTGCGGVGRWDTSYCRGTNMTGSCARTAWRNFCILRTWTARSVSLSSCPRTRRIRSAAAAVVVVDAVVVVVVVCSAPARYCCCCASRCPSRLRWRFRCRDLPGHRRCRRRRRRCCCYCRRGSAARAAAAVAGCLAGPSGARPATLAARRSLAAPPMSVVPCSDRQVANAEASYGRPFTGRRTPPSPSAAPTGAARLHRAHTHTGARAHTHTRVQRVRCSQRRRRAKLESRSNHSLEHSPRWTLTQHRRTPPLQLSRSYYDDTRAVYGAPCDRRGSRERSANDNGRLLASGRDSTVVPRRYAAIGCRRRISPTGDLSARESVGGRASTTGRWAGQEREVNARRA